MTDPVTVTDADREALKPCPFCGGEGMAAFTLDRTFRPMCKRDGCCALDAFTTAAAACVAWNTRATTVLDNEIIDHLHTTIHERGEELARLRNIAKANNALARRYKKQADEFRAKYVAVTRDSIHD